jgi:hypothetical protein
MNPLDTSEPPLLHTTGNEPLAVSTASKVKPGAIPLIFRKSQGGNIPPVKCRKITIVLPVGEEDTDLTDYTQPLGYSRSSVPAKTWNASVSPNKDVYTFTTSTTGPGSGPFTFDAESHFAFSLLKIYVSRLPGQADLTISAELATVEIPADEDWITQEWTVPITKTIEDFFFFRSFSCTTPQVANPGTVTLEWDGSEHETEYWLSYNGRPPERVTGQSKQISGLTDTTTFVLDARTPNPDNAQDPFAHHYLSTTVTVKEPTIHAKSLTATRSIAVPDTFTADHGTKTITAYGPTTFEGDVTIVADNTLTVGGKVDAKAGLDVGGKVDAKAGLEVSGGKVDAKAGLEVSGGKVDAKAGLDVSGGKVDAKAGLDVSGAKLNATAGLDVSGGVLNANGGITIPANQTLTVNGFVDMLGGATLLKEHTGSNKQQWSYSAPTDGLVVGICHIYSKDVSDGWIRCFSNNRWVSTVASATLEWGRANGSGSIVANAKRGQTFICEHEGRPVHGDGAHFTSRFYWIPLGKGAGAPTMRSVESSDNELEQAPYSGIESPTMPASDTTA